MTSVLGMSVGASAVRFARREAESLDRAIFRSRSVTATLERPAEPGAESIETVLVETGEIDKVQAIGVAYRNEAQAGAVQAAMTRLEIGHFQLVPEVTAALHMLETTRGLGDYETLVFYDLGSSGLTVTVVDRRSGTVLSTARSGHISGDLVDRLVLDHQLELDRFTQPADAAAWLALAARCRDAKEQLSTNGAVCLPGEGGLLLLTQESFDALIDGPVKTSARLTREVIRRSGRTPDAAVLIGGGANIPLVSSVMESWLNLPMIVPAQPELVTAEGAALLAGPISSESTDTVMMPMAVSTTDDARPDDARPDDPSGNLDTAHTAETSAPPRIRRTPVLAGGVVAVIAAIGLVVGIDLFQGTEQDTQPVVTQQDVQVPAVRQIAPAQPSTSAEVAPSTESSPPVADRQVTPAETEARTTYEPQTASPVPAPASSQTQGVVPSDTPAPPEPAPLIPGVPQLKVPTLPPLLLPELPRFPGL